MLIKRTFIIIEPLMGLLMGLLVLITMGLSPQLFAHSDGELARYVAPDGIDNSQCKQAAAPCKTIAYAVDQASKGDVIRVAEGSYVAADEEVFLLLSDMIELEGGYSRDLFKSRDSQLHPSVIVGLPAQYRQQLAAKGFRLIRDTKQQAIELNDRQTSLLSDYAQLTQQSQSALTCSNGSAGSFECSNVDLLSQMPLSNFSSNPARANDIWGFADLNDNKEYALIGLRNGTAVVDVSNPSSPVERGFISGLDSTWRDIKVYQFFNAASSRYKAYAYVTTDSRDQGLQIIDLSGLPGSISLANTLMEFKQAHNVYLANVNYATGLANSSLAPILYIAGSSKNNGAFRAFGLSNPTQPNLLFTPPTNNANYVHDAASMVITDARTSQCHNGHNPCELFIDFNEKTVDIWDMTNKNQPQQLSSTGYPFASYTHSGWVSKDKRHIFIQDELDELFNGLNTQLYVLNINDLSKPVIAGTYVGPSKAIDHNGFSKGDKYYMSNYRRGLTILDVSDPSKPKDIGFFDTFPIPAGNTANFDGAWGTYPYLPSGNILVSDIQYGLFVLKDNTRLITTTVTPPLLPSSSNNNTPIWAYLLLLL